MVRPIHVFAAVLLACSAHSTFAADTPEPTRAMSPRDVLIEARKLIAAKQWPAAVDELKRVNNTGSADWNNLMGYSLRKSATPDYAAAEKFYDEALRIDPKHRGALEYSGELFLMTGDLPSAEQRLERLSKICTSCEETVDLKQAVQKFKSAGNRYSAGS